MIYKACLTFFLFVICLSKSSYAQIAEGRANLEKLKSFIGAKATSYVGTYNLHLVMDCSVDEVNDPDSPPQGMSAAPRLQAYREVYEHNGRKTDRSSNHGIKSYMADSIASESLFFQAAFPFTHG